MKTTQIRPRNTYGYLYSAHPGEREQQIEMLENAFGNIYGEYIPLQDKEHFAESGSALHARIGECLTSRDSDHIMVMLDERGVSFDV